MRNLHLIIEGKIGPTTLLPLNANICGQSKQFISILFIIPIIIDMHRHRYEIYTLVSEIPECVYLILGIKNIFE